MTSFKIKRVLVTGAKGFIGFTCLPFLKAVADEIHAIDLNPLANDTNSSINWYQIDLMAADQINKLMKKVRPTHLLHLAWHVEPGMQLNSTQNYRWVKIGLNLAQAFSQFGGQRMVVAGSCAEYDWRYAFCSEKLTPLRPTSAYGVCKHALQKMLDMFCQQKAISFAWGRIFFTYGPRENSNRLVASVIQSLLRGEPAKCSHGNQLRDYLYVKDIANALVKLLASKIEGPVNLASGNPIALKDIIYKIADKLNAGHELIQLGAIPTAEDEPPIIIGDISRLESELKWHPKYNLDNGLTETISWWQNHLPNHA